MSTANETSGQMRWRGKAANGRTITNVTATGKRALKQADTPGGIRAFFDGSAKSDTDAVDAKTNKLGAGYVIQMWGGRRWSEAIQVACPMARGIAMRAECTACLEVLRCIDRFLRQRVIAWSDGWFELVSSSRKRKHTPD